MIVIRKGQISVKPQNVWAPMLYESGHTERKLTSLGTMTFCLFHDTLIFIFQYPVHKCHYHVISR